MTHGPARRPKWGIGSYPGGVGVAIVLILAAGVLAAVFTAASRAERRPRRPGRSIYRDPKSHLTIDGRAKVAYPSLEAAQRAARTQEQRGVSGLRPYACADPRCGKFHLGHG